MTKLKPRTRGEQQAFAAGAAQALNDVNRVGLEEAYRVWEPIFRAVLSRMEKT